jgi:hypothetical protein
MNEFAIDRRNNVLLVKFGGPLTPASLETYNDQLRALVASEGTMAVVIDLTGVSSAGVETSTLVDRGRLPTVMPGQPRVFVAADPAMFGLLRVYAAHQEANGEKPPLVVQSLADAFRHLSLNDPQFEPIAIESRGI